MSNASPLEQFISAIETFLSRHCDPDHPERWLTEEESRQAQRPILDARDEVACFLAPHVGCEQAEAWVHAVTVRWGARASWATQADDAADHLKYLDMVRHYSKISDLPLLFRQARNAVRTSQRQRGPKKRRRVPASAQDDHTNALNDAIAEGIRRMAAEGKEITSRSLSKRLSRVGEKRIPDSTIRRSKAWKQREKNMSEQGEWRGSQA